MQIKNLKIGTQLKLGLISMMAFVLLLGYTAYIQTDRIHQQTVIMHNHPLLVQRAIGFLRSDILAIDRDMKDLRIVTSEEQFSQNLQHIEAAKNNAYDQIKILEKRYLGDLKDVESVKKAFIHWNTQCAETISHLQHDRDLEDLPQQKLVNTSKEEVSSLLSLLESLDSFAWNKADELSAASNTLNKGLRNQLFVLIAIILLMTVLINFIILRNIRKPLDDLTLASTRFQEGDYSSRSAYSSKNEFGTLSFSFNKLAQSIQNNIILNKKTSDIKSAMLSQEDSQEFFRLTLSSILEETGAQMAGAYLLSEDKKSLNLYYSIGLDNNIKKTFDCEQLEGEFGQAISTGQIQYLRKIPENTPFSFHTISGKFQPKEIITIPIVSGNETFAIISLASIRTFEPQSIQFINSIISTLTPRIQGILAFGKIKAFSKKLEDQFSELEAQRSELIAQSSELKEQNTELTHQKNQLREASRLKTNFLSNMSHELRTPLNSVIALSGVLNRKLVNQIPDEEYSYIEVIERNGKNLLALINDILDISRIESGKEELDLINFNMSTLIKEVIDLIHPQASQKKIDIVSDDVPTNLMINSDNIKCQHILQNLISNAIKFTETGKVEVLASQDSNKVMISIKDTGIGISNDHIEHIFDEFRQADGSTSRRYGGTGLGLAIAKKYALLLGGNIEVSSTKGIGSVFTLSLPINFAPTKVNAINTNTSFSQKNEELTTYASMSMNSSKTILLVEDSEPAIIQMQDFLEEVGFNLLIASNGAEALELINYSIPDAMIVDLMMPDIDGFELLATLREAEPTANIPVLILTAKHITKKELSFLKRNNIHQLIQKGDVKRDQLLHAIDRMVNPPRQNTTKPTNSKNENLTMPVILVVEDNPDNMTTVKALLKDQFEVLEANDGIQGVELAEKHLPNIILMDIALPERDGIEAFKMIRNQDRLQHIPVIALTASAMLSDRETLLAHGFNAYIPKPIDIKTFYKTINNTLYG